MDKFSPRPFSFLVEPIDWDLTVLAADPCTRCWNGFIGRHGRGMSGHDG